MPDIDDIRRRRSELERQKSTLAARLLAEEGAAAKARRAGELQSATSAERRIKTLRSEAIAAATGLRAAEAQIGTLLAEAVIMPPPPATAETPVIDLLGPVPQDVPLLLMPIRLEIRFTGTAPARELLVRVFPDDIHVDTHEPGLTSDELSAGKRYWTRAWTKDADTEQAAWTQLANSFSAERAAWIAQVLTPTNLKNRPSGTPSFPEVDSRPSSWSRAPRANTLPDRWIFLGYEGGARVLAVTGEPIPDVLPVGPSPEGEGETAPAGDVALDAGMRWLINFEAAVKAGMAVRVPLPAAAVNGLSRLLVFGVKRSLGIGESAAALTALLDAQHYTRGISCIPPGTPTNNTTNTISGFDSRDSGHECSFANERNGPLFTPKSDADGAIVARTLGISAAPLQQLPNAGENHTQSARLMNAVLWPATWGYYLEQRLAGTVSDAELRMLRQHFVEFVRAGGPMPSLRIGRQPYGFLPVTSLDHWRPAGTDDAGTRALDTLRGVREAFRRSLGKVPRMREAETNEQDLLSVLRLRPYSRGHQVRNILGPMFVSNYFGFLGASLPQGWWAAHRSIVNPVTLGGITPTTPQSLASLASHLEATNGAPLVAIPEAKPDYLTRLAAGGYRAALEDRDAPPAPRPMLYLLARHALLIAYAQAANRIALRAGVLPAGGQVEPELVGIDPNITTETLWQRLEKPIAGVTGQRTLGAFLDDRASGKDPDVRELTEVRAALRELARTPVNNLERMLLETLDLATHRFDAWATSLATRRLATLRESKSSGLRLGGFGWLEELRPAGSPVSNGFVQVPSLDHAAMAAVLANGYLSHRNASGPSPFEIDLSSDRVRTARWLLQGVRTGQTLGALLGYRIERGMHEADLSRHVDEVRKLYGQESGIDGLKLLEEHRSAPGDFAKLAAAVGNDVSGLREILTSVDLELDALGDLLVAEGVFQATRGNFERAGLSLGSVINGQALPEPESMDTPRTGVVVTHRVLKLMSAKIPAGRNASSPRALAEPRLNRWLADILGDLNQVRCRVSYQTSKGTVERMLALPELALTPLDLVAHSDDNLEQLILAAAMRNRPAKVPATAEVRLISERDSSWPREVTAWPEYLYFLGAVRKLLASVRPMLGVDLAPADRRDDSTVDLAELRKRADAAVTRLRKAVALKSPGMTLQAFGIFGSVIAVVAEAKDRLNRIQSVEKSFARDKATPSQQVDHDGDRIRIVFGATFPVLPLIKAGNGVELTTAFGASKALQLDDPLAASAWLDRVAHVHSRASHFQEMARLRAALSGLDEASTVGQLPYAKGDTWVALPVKPGSIPSGRLAFVACGDLPDLKASCCGVVIDEWTEMVPGARETTGLTFQFDRPAARPPQACLLAVAPDVTRPWDMNTLEAVLLETLELSQLRLVDQDALTELDHYLPALQFALNVAVPSDTVSTDFRAVPPS